MKSHKFGFGVIAEDAKQQYLSYGDTVPVDGTAGYAPGALYIHTDGSGLADRLYQNIGSLSACNFDALASASNMAISDAGGLITATDVEDALQEIAAFAQPNGTAGVGVTGTADNFVSGVQQFGSIYKTTIVADIDGLNCGGTSGDIIGADAAGVAHLGQLTAAVNGTIFAGELRCIEAPAGGNADIDLWSADEATGVEDTAISALTETKLCNSGALSAGSVIPLTAYPTADEYLYLVCGSSTDATYTAGILVLELWGK